MVNLAETMALTDVQFLKPNESRMYRTRYRVRSFDMPDVNRVLRTCRNCNAEEALARTLGSGGLARTRTQTVEDAGAVILGEMHRADIFEFE